MPNPEQSNNNTAGDKSGQDLGDGIHASNPFQELANMPSFESRSRELSGEIDVLQQQEKDLKDKLEALERQKESVKKEIWTLQHQQEVIKHKAERLERPSPEVHTLSSHEAAKKYGKRFFAVWDKEDGENIVYFEPSLVYTDFETATDITIDAESLPAPVFEIDVDGISIGITEIFSSEYGDAVNLYTVPQGEDYACVRSCVHTNNPDNPWIEVRGHTISREGASLAMFPGHEDIPQPLPVVSPRYEDDLGYDERISLPIKLLDALEEIRESHPAIDLGDNAIARARILGPTWHSGSNDIFSRAYRPDYSFRRHHFKLDAPGPQSEQDFSHKEYSIPWR